MLRSEGNPRSKILQFTANTKVSRTARLNAIGCFTACAEVRTVSRFRRRNDGPAHIQLERRLMLVATGINLPIFLRVDQRRDIVESKLLAIIDIGLAFIALIYNKIAKRLMNISPNRRATGMNRLP